MYSLSASTKFEFTGVRRLMGTYCRVSGIFVAFIGATFAAENCWSTGVFGPKINNVVYGIDWRPGFFERAGDRCYTEG